MVTTYGARSVTLFQAMARHVGVQGALDRVHEAAVTIKTAVNALRAERDGLRTDLNIARKQIENLCRALEGLAPDPTSASPAPERMCTACGHGERLHSASGRCWTDTLDGELWCLCTQLLIVPDEIDDDAAAVERAQAGAP